jgi:hypothetical protein
LPDVQAQVESTAHALSIRLHRELKEFLPGKRTLIPPPVKLKLLPPRPALRTIPKNPLHFWPGGPRVCKGNSSDLASNGDRCRSSVLSVFPLVQSVNTVRHFVLLSVRLAVFHSSGPASQYFRGYLALSDRMAHKMEAKQEG